MHPLSTLVSSLNSCIVSQLFHSRSSASTLNSNIYSQLQHSLSTLPFTLSTPTSQEPRQGSSPSSPCTLYHNSPRVLPSARKIRRKKVAGKREKRGGWYQNAFIQDVLVFIAIPPPPPPCLPTLCPRYTTHTYSCCLGKREIGKRKRDKRVRKGHLCANDLNQLPMPATWWSTRRWPSTPPAMHLAPNCLHSLTHARSTHHKRHQKAFTHTTTADR